MTEKKPQLIGLCGLAGSGKSAVADYIYTSQFNWVRVPFAEPLKKMLSALGLSWEQLYGGFKEIPSPLLCGRTPRHAMQTLGTEWGRQLIGDDIWINAWRQTVVSKLTDGKSVIVEDLRFVNEAAAIKDLGGEIWRIERPGLAVQGHISETEQMTIQQNWIMDNSSTLDDLQARIDVLLEFTQ